MSETCQVRLPPPDAPAERVDDAFLLAGFVAGDEAALRKLIDRYDRLVRYTVFRASRERCLHDPAWLDALASATWAGFVQSIRRAGGTAPDSIRAYLVRIAHNQVISALRRDTAREPTLSLTDIDADPSVQDPMLEPVELLARIESLDALRRCLAELNADDRTLVSQLQAIMDRRWREAAAALGMPESTLRSRWRQTLGRLRACLKLKTGESFAPPGEPGD